MGDPAATNCVTPKKIAAVLVGLMFPLSLVSRAIRWDSLFDTA